MRRLFIVSLLIAAALLSVLAASCSRGPAAFGVILWPPEGSPLQAGRQVELDDRPEEGELVAVPQEESEEEIGLESWRIRIFDDRDEAQRFAESYAQYTQTYAEAERLALPIRESPDNSDQTQIVYRLREGEIMKVLERSDSLADVGGLQDYWYHVLTREGVSGWVFGYHLRVFSTEQGLPAGEAEEEGEEDAALEIFFRNIWRPIYFAEMAESGHIDLERFRSEYGLFPDREARELRLRLPDHGAVFAYERIVPAGRNRYTFQGTGFQLLVRSEQEISIQYTAEGSGHNIAMQTIEEDIEALRQEELQERAQRYQNLYRRGPIFESNAYGTIRLQADRSFTWSGNDRLIPSVIPANAGNSGEVRLSLFITDSLRSRYDGAVSFHYPVQDEEDAVHFLYQYRSDGVRFVHVPSRNVEEKLIREEPLSPLILFFSFRS